MSSIRILPDEISNRIAAGEVVERPASVVKELVENSVDAGARRISVAIENGGRKLVQVTDDGSGMDKDDAMLCLEAHATSKIAEVFDIDRITTLGFRGEALPSIAGVSRFRLQTRQRGAVAGVEVQVDGGTLKNVQDCGCAEGTSITVRNLFFNLPARRKFLRSAATEEAHIQEMVLLQALAHPSLGFELSINGQKVFQVPPESNVRSRVGMLLGRDVLDQMTPVEYSESDMHVSGFIARPGMTRSNRREQRVVVNGRPAVADPIYFGIRDAYHTLVMKGRYPPVVLYLELPPDQVDVNVHPTKREVRFRDGRGVSQVVAAAVRRTLQALASDYAGHVGGSTHPRPPQPAQPMVPPAHQQEFITQVEMPRDFSTAPSPIPASNESPSVEPSGDTSESPFLNHETVENSAAGGVKGTSASAATRPEIRSLKVLGVYRSLYLVAEGEHGLVLIDQHAAHERILFERLLVAAKDRDGASQALLIPLNVEFTPADAEFLKQNLKTFLDLGFGIDEFGGSSFLITGIPAHFPQENVEGMLRDVLDDLRDAPGISRRPDEIRIAQAACKHAVRAEDPLTPEEIETLLASLAETEMPYTCPHGRPVMINLPETELQKRFGRRA